jgi:hypothetical protein
MSAFLWMSQLDLCSAPSHHSKCVIPTALLLFHLEVLGQPSLHVWTWRKPYILPAGILEHGLTRSFASDNWRDLERSKKLAT